MKKSLLTLLFTLVTLYLQAQPKVNIYAKTNANGYEIYANNPEPCPVSLKLDLEMKNLKSSKGNHKIFVLPANKKEILLTSLSPIKKGKYSYKSSCLTNFGDHNKGSYNVHFPYYLPFEQGKSFKISQGYNGTFSHQNQFALDFKMDESTNIAAARDGIVISIVDENDKGCAQEECKKYNNYIIVYHQDGTFAEYVHIKKNGAKVKKGDQVKAGQIIAASGNTGWSSGPHLHFSVFLQKLQQRKTIRTKFKTNEGNTPTYLKAQETYSRNYE